MGRWKVTRLRRPSSCLAICGEPGDIIEFTARGDFIVRSPAKSGGHTDKDRFKCVTSHNPPWIDLIMDTTSRRDRCLGLYRINGDELLLCTGQMFKPRPDRLVRLKKSWVFNEMKRLTKQ